MSGGGGSGSHGGGGAGGGMFDDSGGGGGVNCSTLAFEAVVMSPNPAVVAAIAVGSMCEVLLVGTPRQLAVIVRDSGEVLGAITERWADLTACIDGGYAYEAEVLSLRPVRVRITPRQPYRLVRPFVTFLVDRPTGADVADDDRLDVVFDRRQGPVALHGITGEVIGRVPAEPVALPEALRNGIASVARVEDARAGRIVITDT